MFLLFGAAVYSQDAVSSLSDRLESASREERAKIISAEGPTETLRAAYRALGAKSFKYFQNAEYEKTLDLNLFLLDIADLFQQPRMKGTPYQMMGESLGRQNRNEEALETFRLGLPIAVAAGDKRLQAILWSEMGTALRVLGRGEESRTAGENAVRLFQDSDNQRDAAQALIALGVTVRAMGEWQLAVDYYTRAMKLGEALKNQKLVDSALGDIADVYISQHDYSVALSYVERISKPGGSSMEEKARASAYYARLGNLYFRMKRPEARELLEQALGGAREVRDSPQQAWVLSRLAEMEEEQKPEAALQRYTESAAIYGRTGNAVQQSSSLAYLARLYTRLKDPVRAAEAARGALEVARKAGAPMFIGGALDELGRALRDVGKAQEAELAFQESIHWTELQRLDLNGGNAGGANFLSGRSAPYTSLMDLRAADGDALTAIRLSEQVRARWLVDTLLQGKVDPQKGLSPEEKEREQALAREAARLNAELTRATAPTEPKASGEAKAAFEKAAGDLESYRRELYAAHGRLKARRGQMEAITSDAMMSLVPHAGALLIEYASCERGVWVFTVARGAGGPVVKATKLSVKLEELEQRVEEFRRSLATRDLSYSRLAKGLYRDLLEPIEAELRGRSIVGIVPDGPLWNLPFQALISGDGKYMVERAAVYYAPSLTELYESSRARARSGGPLKPLLALGAGARELPNSADEVQKLAHLYGPGSVALTGAEATEKRWKQDAGGYRVLHVATHGILNSTNPMFSYLQLAKEGDEDGMLEAREILDANLRAEIAVLSACETGRGELIGGEGLVGMSWAVLTAGTPTVVVSQWKVDSGSTTQLMLAFHRGIAAGARSRGTLRGKAEALRAAELELIRTPGYRHPFYWAGFEMLGDGY